MFSVKTFAISLTSLTMTTPTTRRTMSTELVVLVVPAARVPPLPSSLLTVRLHRLPLPYIPFSILTSLTYFSIYRCKAGARSSQHPHGIQAADRSPSRRDGPLRRWRSRRWSWLGWSWTRSWWWSFHLLQRCAFGPSQPLVDALDLLSTLSPSFSLFSFEGRV